MSNLKSPNVGDVQNIGQFGNLSVATGGYTLASAQVADTVDLVTVPAGSRIFDTALVNAALGASSTVSLGWKYADGSAGGSATALVPATSTAAAAKTRSIVAPIDVEKDVIVYATVAGAAATGRVDVNVQYLHRGMK